MSTSFSAYPITEQLPTSPNCPSSPSPSLPDTIFAVSSSPFPNQHRPPTSPDTPSILNKPLAPPCTASSPVSASPNTIIKQKRPARKPPITARATRGPRKSQKSPSASKKKSKLRPSTKEQPFLRLLDNLSNAFAAKYAPVTQKGKKERNAAHAKKSDLKMHKYIEALEKVAVTCTAASYSPVDIFLKSVPPEELDGSPHNNDRDEDEEDDDDDTARAQSEQSIPDSEASPDTDHKPSAQPSCECPDYCKKGIAKDDICLCDLSAPVRSIVDEVFKTKEQDQKPNSFPIAKSDEILVSQSATDSVTGNIPSIAQLTSGCVPKSDLDVPLDYKNKWDLLQASSEVRPVETPPSEAPVVTTVKAMPTAETKPSPDTVQTSFSPYIQQDTGLDGETQDLFLSPNRWDSLGDNPRGFLDNSTGGYYDSVGSGGPIFMRKTPPEHTLAFSNLLSPKPNDTGSWDRETVPQSE